MQAEKTKELFDFCNEMTKWIISDAEPYKNFLSWASRFTAGYTIANQILIYGYNNNAKLVYDEQTWNSYGINVVDRNPIYVMEYAPEQSEMKYIPREVFDISQTDGSYPDPFVFTDKGAACENLLLSAPCKVQYVEQMRTKGTKGMYYPEENLIEVTKGCKSFDEIFSVLASEYAHQEFCSNQQAHRKAGKDVSPVKGYPRGRYNWDAFSVAYALGARYQMDLSAFPFSVFPSSWTDKKTKPSDIRNELNLIINCCHKMDARILHCIEREVDKEC